ncbi:MAG: PEP-CTERM sorting domain-containing protein [Burkholderiales bacterium]|nr:PEP-CTERM sorting domain-containing protein [Burkholderiales bacterium]
MTSKRVLRVAPMASFVLAIGLSGSAAANITLEFGDTLLNGAFNNIRYGPSGTGEAFLTPLLSFAPDVMQSPRAHADVTELSFQYATSGLGTPSFVVSYSLHNDSAATTFSDLRFVVNVEPTGSPGLGSFLDNVIGVWGPKGPFDPDAREIDAYSPDPITSLPGRIISNKGVNDGANGCAGPCDADFALQWNRAQLAPGETWRIGLMLSDSPGAPASQRFLRAVSADDANTMLTISAVPEPAEYVLFGVGLGVLALLRRRPTR